MKKKTKITLTASVLAVFSLVITASQTNPREPMPQPDVRPVSAVIELSEDNIPPTAEIDFEPRNPQATKEISDLTDSRRDKATLAQVLPENTDKITVATTEKEAVEVLPTAIPASTKTTEPKMGDKRVVNGQKQVYFLGFGWIDDYDEPNVAIYLPDMYENGNKIGIMGGDTVGHSDTQGADPGDINKMVGIMD